jgi:hypothetical protein
MGEDEGEFPVRLKKDVKEPALLPKKPVLHMPTTLAAAFSRVAWLCNAYMRPCTWLQESSQNLD